MKSSFTFWETIVIIAFALVIAVAICGAMIGLASNAAPWQPKPAVLNQAWGWASSCSVGIPPRFRNPYGDLKHVAWQTFTPGALNDSTPGNIIGQTVRNDSDPIDTIYIDEVHQDTVWVIAHELLHHILADPEVWGSAHPFVPFAFPCHLLEFQQGDGIGLMGQGLRPKRARIFARANPVIADLGYCADVTSPQCPVRDFWPRAERLTSAGVEAYFFIAEGRPTFVAFVTRSTYAKYGRGQIAPDGLIWRESRP